MAYKATIPGLPNFVCVTLTPKKGHTIATSLRLTLVGTKAGGRLERVGKTEKLPTLLVSNNNGRRRIILFDGVSLEDG